MSELLNLSGYHYRKLGYYSRSTIITAAGVSRQKASKQADLFANPDGIAGRESFYTPARAKAIIAKLRPSKSTSTLMTDFISGKYRNPNTAASSASGVLNLAGKSTGAHYE